MRKLTLICLGVLSLASARAQTSAAPTPKMDFETYNPTSTLVVPTHPANHSKFPFIDVHNHQGNMSSANLQGLLKDMDKLNMKIMVNLSGGNGDNLRTKIDNIKSTSPKRFIVFANIDFRGVGEAGWTEKAVK